MASSDLSFLATSDLHLTSAPRDAYRWEIFPWLLEQSVRRGIRSIVIAGDITDQKDRHQAPLVNRLVRELARFQDKGIDLLMIPGNHDYIDSTCPFFSFLHSPTDGRFFFTTPTIHELRSFAEVANVLFLPHSRRLDADWARTVTPAMWRQADVVVGHLSILGAKASNGESMSGLRPSYFRPRVRPGVPIILGDIHIPQRIGPIHYCGSPHPVHFGDGVEPRVLRWSMGQKLVSIPRTTIRKMHLRVGDPNDLAEMFETQLREHDQLRLSVVLPRESYYLWPEIRTNADRLAKEKGVELYSCEPVAAAAAAAGELRTQELRNPASNALQSLRAFAKREKVEKDALEFGLSLLGAVGVPVRPSVGDFDPKTVEIQGFRSFATRQTIKFDLGTLKGTDRASTAKFHGLVFLSGKNVDRPRLGPNGVGKSTILDAIKWCLYGRTTRGLFGPSVKNWGGSSECMVRLTFANAQGRWTVCRTQSPNTLTLSHAGEDPKHVTDADIVSLVGLRVEEFPFVVLMGQFDSHFFDLGDAEKLELFTHALQLNVWTDAAERAKEVQETQEGVRKLAEEELASLNGRISVQKESLARLVPVDASSIEDASDALASLRADLEKAQEEQKEARAASDRAVQALAAIKSKSRAGEVRGLNERLEELEQDVLHLKEQLRSAKSNVCPTCKQPMKGKHEDVVAHLNEEIVSKQRLMGELTEKLAQLKDVSKEGLEDATKEASRTSQVWAKKDALVSSLTTKVATARANVKNLERGREEYEKEHARLTSSIAATKDKIKANTTSLNAATKAIGHAAYWIKQFRQIRFLLAKDAMDEMAVDVNATLGRLGLPDWTVSFEAERSTGTGAVSRGFFVYISAPGAPEKVPFAAWCGGETQRLRVAGSIGISNLISSRTGVRSGVEMWDEPTTHLSEEGVLDLLEFLKDRAEEEGKQIWVADHRSPAFGGFLAEYQVTKESGRSSVRRVKHQDGE